MNVAKVIRALGYAVYTILWLPITVLYAVVTPIACIGMCIKDGDSVEKCVAEIKRTLITELKHDLTFIQSGEW